MISKIIVLPESIANRIAAGEIIERPASVVRELLDNAIDAGADRIEVDIENGGLSMMRVTDNGRGIDPEGLLLAFERHATSKVRNLEDLDTISTLGFRGEALPSIASVARVTMESFAPDHDTGARLQIDGGKIQHVENRVCPVGTRVTVRNLFYNTPARRKFMKSVKTETMHLHDTVVDHALAHKSIHFVYRENGRTVLDVPAVDLWSARIGAVFGKKFIGEMIPMEKNVPDISIHGMICHPNHLRSTGRSQRLFVNGRRVRDRTVTQAVYRGYAQYITGSGHPAYVLRIDLPPEMVDVNVHPAKSEVRFRNPGALFNLVSTGVHQTLSGTLKTRYRDPVNPAHRDGAVTDAAGQPGPADRGSFRYPSEPSTGAAVDPVPAASGPDTASEQPALLPISDRRLVGQVFNTFILIDDGRQMLVIDQHTAHERILFEKFKSMYQQGTIPSQTLLFPAPVELERPQYEVITNFLDLLGSMGVVCEPFGKDTLAVRALPDHLKQEAPDLLLRNLADELLEVGATERSRIAERKMLVSLACRRAIKAGDPLNTDEMDRLIREMFDNDIPNACPHGRPIIVAIPYDEIARRFKR